MSTEQKPRGSRWPARVIAGTVVAALAVIYAGSWRISSQIDATMRELGVVAPTQAEVLAKSAKQKAETEAAIAALKKVDDYQRAVWIPIHFKPDIDKASNELCLTCHQEVLGSKVRAQSPAGVEAKTAVAWYQTLDTYAGDQETFHARHLSSPFAKMVMNLSCTFCHQGHDPRERAPGASATAAPATFSMRKTVTPAQTCLLCHGKFPGQSMGFEDQKWSELREGLENADAPNGCLTCHAEQFRTVRHQVSYLNADAIEAAAKAGSSDTCYGCHGGRAWYRISYPYPRHPWPGMDADTPGWAKDRPTVSDAKFAIKK